MSRWEPSLGATNEWFTPAYIFDALGLIFDLDVAHPADRRTHVPARQTISSGSLESEWCGLVWMNPPFGGRNGLTPWLDKFVSHGNGVALVPDRTSAPWFQAAVRNVDLVLFLSPKVKFERPDGSLGVSPGTGTALLSIGQVANDALVRARGLGWLSCNFRRG